MCALSTSTSRLGSPKNAAIRPDTRWNGRSRAAPFSFQFAIGTTRNRWWASAAMSIPEVLQVVVVRRRAASLDLRDDPAPLAEPVGEIGT